MFSVESLIEVMFKDVLGLIVELNVSVVLIYTIILSQTNIVYNNIVHNQACFHDTSYQMIVAI